MTVDISHFPLADQRRIQTAQFRVEVMEFQKTTIGKYLIVRAEQERQAALDSLAVVNAWDERAIRDLQMVIRRADSFAEWLLDAVDNGEIAELEQQEIDRG